MTKPGEQILPPPRKPLGQTAFDVLLWGGIAVMLIISFGPVNMAKVPLLFTNSSNMQEFGRDFLHPDFTDWRLYVAKMWETVEIAFWGTFLAVVLAIPMGLLGARNISPPWIQLPVRRILDVFRAVPDLVMGTMFLVAVGLGPLTGVLAIALNTGGVLGKLFAEGVESIEPGPIEGVRATGATRLQEIVWGVFPQVAPLWTSYGLYRFESSSRSATVLGLIGAGGIGSTLFDQLNSFAYTKVSAIVIVITIAVALIDLLSQTIRSRLI
ncbi:MAG TPA: phosphonate ABC transporter, permease protein PhnE [Caulobacteraceae bacterium]|nr:phosphonate ABC transporter, permease protein PhnE [Caulobacteraceae bacterium]